MQNGKVKQSALPPSINKLITDALAIEEEEAKQAEALGYMANVLVQATLPHSKVQGNEFIRKNGALTFSIIAPSHIGLPYGNIPRLLLAWLTTEAVLNKTRTLYLGDTLASFMRKLGLGISGGEKGDITRLKEQSRRLFMSSMSCVYDSERASNGVNLTVADAFYFWEAQKDGEPDSRNVILSDAFYRAITENPIPIDMRAISALKSSSLALDIYCWLTYRMSYLRRTARIPWELLQVQFGSGYPSTPQGKRNFKRAFLRELKKVVLIYPKANVEITAKTFILQPSVTHVSKIRLV